VSEPVIGLSSRGNIAAATILRTSPWPANISNWHKGSNLSGRDPLTAETVALFHPRRQVWHEHFRHDGAVIVGLTSVGRTTVETLGMNAPDRLKLRSELLATGQLR
jgi:hypothetical protein